MERSMKPLAGRVALVTGVGPGLGCALALALAEAGADVVAYDVSDASLALRLDARPRQRGRDRPTRLHPLVKRWAGSVIANPYLTLGGWLPAVWSLELMQPIPAGRLGTLQEHAALAPYFANAAACLAGQSSAPTAAS
jgi:hypothetical protein